MDGDPVPKEGNVNPLGLVCTPRTRAGDVRVSVGNTSRSVPGSHRTSPEPEDTDRRVPVGSGLVTTNVKGPEDPLFGRSVQEGGGVTPGDLLKPDFLLRGPVRSVGFDWVTDRPSGRERESLGGR